ncbi:hypothetical protein DSO57_1032834 [Entomophthora muscae]|uniref:Uncharacterized protein n=1 Tax=Entomophthora muscae TaxID=34485 RepID=A0ACC2ULA6_9FUNG|nr:hypothetical protein DSO57_1032834 [Entomophthora muscae]
MIKVFPALKTFDYTGFYGGGWNLEHFVYDVENMVFKEIGFPCFEEPFSAFIRFHDDIPPKTPLLSLDEEVTHESQFRDLLNANTDNLFDFIHQFACLDAIYVRASFIELEEFVQLLLSLKDIPSLSFNIEYQDFYPDLCKETFKATTVFLEVHESKLPSFLEWLATCLPNLEELGIELSDGPVSHDETKDSESKSTFEFWKKLIESRPNLSKIHLPNDFPTRCQIEKKYPHILVGNKCKAR